ncbi:MAG: hypothetical protein M3Z25_04105 [Actinomycetota bacterium]|nr:hypothetical protein [Actinomycetota bacterium]
MTRDQQVTRLANAVAGCVTEGCLAASKGSIFAVAAHVAEHTPDGTLPEWVESALIVAESSHSAMSRNLLDLPEPEPNWEPGGSPRT